MRSVTINLDDLLCVGEMWQQVCWVGVVRRRVGRVCQLDTAARPAKYNAVSIQ